MHRRFLVALLLLLPVAGNGCATALNMQDETLRKPYGGFSMPISEFFGGGDFGELGGVLFWPLWLVDKPLSLFADTVTLPYTLWVQHDRSLPQAPPSAPPLANSAHP